MGVRVVGGGAGEDVLGGGIQEGFEFVLQGDQLVLGVEGVHCLALLPPQGPLQLLHEVVAALAVDLVDQQVGVAVQVEEAPQPAAPVVLVLAHVFHDFGLALADGLQQLSLQLLDQPEHSFEFGHVGQEVCLGLGGLGLALEYPDPAALRRPDLLHHALHPLRWLQQGILVGVLVLGQALPAQECCVLAVEVGADVGGYLGVILAFLLYASVEVAQLVL